MVGRLSSLVGDEVGTRVYVLLNRVQLWRICSLFFLLFGVLVAEHYTKIDRASNRVQLWRICSLFFLFFPRCSLVGEGSPGGHKGDMVQLWRVCAVFFSGSLPPV